MKIRPKTNNRIRIYLDSIVVKNDNYIVVYKRYLPNCIEFFHTPSTKEHVEAILEINKAYTKIPQADGSHIYKL